MPAESSQYLSIVFFGTHVLAALWQEHQQKVTIIARSPIKDLTQHDTLAEAVDLSLEELGEDSLSVRQVLFVIPQAWTDQGQITNQHKDELKNLSQELLLEPLGFVVIEDGLQTWQENTTQTSFSGVIVHHHQNALQVRVSIESEIAATFQIGKSGQVREDIIELQARLKPYLNQISRVLFFDTSGQDNEYNHLLVLLRQQLGKPVEKLTPQQVADITINSGGQEMLGVGHHVETLSTPTPDDQPNTTSNSEFRQPSFVVNSPASTESEANTEEITSNLSEEESNFEPVLPTKPVRKRKGFRFPQFVFTPRRSKKLLIGVTIGLILIGLFVSSLVIAQQSYQARVELAVVNQKLETVTTLPLILNDATNSAEPNRIPATEPTETITVMKEVPTTGTKLTGDKATGTIIIYNKTSETKTFPKGTKVVANNKSFSLDNDVTVASASAQETRSSRTERFGEAEAAVTADSFGPEYNLEEKQEFTVDDFGSSSYDATNDKAFTGGTSREIQSVAQKDIDSALTALKEEATATLRERFQAQSTPEKPVLVTDTIDIQDYQSSVAVGNEAKLVTVSMTTKGHAYQLQMADLTEVAQSVFGEQLEEGYIFSPENLSFSNERLIIDGAQPELELQLKAQAIPEINLDEARSMLQGEFISRATSILGRLPGVKQVKAELRPTWLRYIFRRMPNNPERIQLEIRPEI